MCPRLSYSNNLKLRELFLRSQICGRDKRNLFLFSRGLIDEIDESLLECGRWDAFRFEMIGKNGSYSERNYGKILD